jgi:hypothetical protein
MTVRSNISIYAFSVPVEGLWPVARSARINSSLCATSKLREWLVLIYYLIFETPTKINEHVLGSAKVDISTPLSIIRQLFFLQDRPEAKLRPENLFISHTSGLSRRSIRPGMRVALSRF